MNVLDTDRNLFKFICINFNNCMSVFHFFLFLWVVRQCVRARECICMRVCV